MNDGGQAFPHDADYIRDGKGGYTFNVPFHPGMSLRDYFAAKAMEGILTDPAMRKLSGPPLPDEIENQKRKCARSAARAAYRFADAMLAEREPKPDA